MDNFHQVFNLNNKLFIELLVSFLNILSFILLNYSISFFLCSDNYDVNYFSVCVISIAHFANGIVLF